MLFVRGAFDRNRRTPPPGLHLPGGACILRIFLWRREEWQTPEHVIRVRVSIGACGKATPYSALFGSTSPDARFVWAAGWG